MNRQEFKKWALSALRMFDGSTGNTLSRRGMPAGAAPEQWIIENPGKLIELQREFIDAGTEVMLTATLGATAPKLAEYGITDVEGYNRKLFEITKQAVGEKTRIAAELGPTGKFMAPMGDKSFEDMVGIYIQQVAALLPCKPDMFILETFIDLAEARAAVIAIRDLCDLPVIASMTFQNGMTLTGSTPEAVAVTLTAAGADAVGANCSTGPQGVAEVVAKMAAVCDLPLFAKPNAGMPQLIDGRTVFRMGPEEFAKEALALVKAGATLVGGCCGATPEHIKEFKQRIRDLEPAPRAQVQKAYVSSRGRRSKSASIRRFASSARGSTRPAVKILRRALSTATSCLRWSLPDSRSRTAQICSTSMSAPPGPTSSRSWQCWHPSCRYTVLRRCALTRRMPRSWKSRYATTAAGPY